MQTSKYENQQDDNHVICPYCKYEYQPEGGDHSEDSSEVECEECGMSYYLHQSFSVTHHTRPDCELNGVEHTWGYYAHTNASDLYVCTVCDKIQRLV